MNGFLESEGYEGMTPIQADLIFRTNVQTAYNAGHYEQMSDPAVRQLRPYWQYDAVNDTHTRPSHLAMDGRVYPADSPVWDTAQRLSVPLHGAQPVQTAGGAARTHGGDGGPAHPARSAVFDEPCKGTL